MKITSEQGYNLALSRLEELEGIVSESTPETDKNYKEMDSLIEAIDSYEAIHYPIGKPSLAATLQLRMYEMNLTKTKMSQIIGVSSSAISRYLTGKSEPSLTVARRICNSLKIDPAIVLGV